MNLQEIRSAEAQLIGGIITRDNADVFTARGGGHYMDDWDWFQGVALFALYKYAKKTGDRTVYSYLTDWFDSHIRAGLPAKNINSMCPLLTLSYLYEESGRQEYMDICREWAEYAMHFLPRTLEGGFQHVTIDSDNYMQLWDDTLYMTVLFIGRMGTLTGRDEYTQESIRQFLVHLKYLTDPVTGLFYHGFNFDGLHHYAGALWGRGNAWYTAGLVDYLDMTALPGGVRAFLISSLARQADALEKYRDAEGMWHTLINDTEGSYAESSASAGFAYGLMKAARKGYIDGHFRALGLESAQAVLKRIDGRGILQGVSAGTCLMDTLDEYRQVRQCAEPYGQSMALMMLLEAEEDITETRK
ncbi:MAG: glycoside hydrolase family 88 protein [Clostridia bacterium]|nr:glycoside hydrolase family 88 protein [Clostridia bacterium]